MKKKRKAVDEKWIERREREKSGKKVLFGI